MVPIHPHASPTRLPFGCVEACPACRHRRLSPAASLAAKFTWVERQLWEWRDWIEPVRTPAPARRLGYRERVSLRTVWLRDAWHFGLSHRDDLIPIPDCPVHSDRVRAMLRVLAGVLPNAERFPMAFYVQSGGQATLVLKSNRTPDLAWLTPAVETALAATGIDGLWLNLHPSAGVRLFSKRGWRRLWGNPESRNSLGLRHGPATFQQVLPELHQRSMAEAVRFLNPGPASAVLDLYCGHGATLACWTHRGAATLGVELGGESVEYARRNAPAATVLRGACTTRLPQLRDWVARYPRPLVYLNPPRTGLEPAVLSWLAEEVRPPRVAYLSCSMGTLKRDLAVLAAAGYRPHAIQPYDFFPQTQHVEALALVAHRAG